MPLTRVPLVWKVPSPHIPVARTPWMILSPFACIHRNIQGKRATSFETHFDEVSTILLRCEDGGPHARLVDKRGPPGLANVYQPQEVVQAISGRRYDEFEDLEDDFGGGIVNKALRSLELGLTRMSGYDTILTCGLCYSPVRRSLAHVYPPLRTDFGKHVRLSKSIPRPPSVAGGGNWLR